MAMGPRMLQPIFYTGGKKKCPACGQRFYATSSWVYKTAKHNGKVRCCCSYTCWRKEERKREGKRRDTD